MPPDKKPSPLRLVPPPRRTARDRLRQLLWTVEDDDLHAVLDACRDEKLTKRLAAVVREQQAKDSTQPRQFDRLITWLGSLDESKLNAPETTHALVEAIDQDIDPQTGAVYIRPRSVEEIDGVRWALIKGTDGEQRLRGALTTLKGAKISDKALKYRHMRAKRS